MWRAFAIPAAMLGALTFSGCSFQLSSLLSRDTTADADATSSVGHARAQAATEVPAFAPAEADLAYARAVAADALSRAGRDSSVPWENPHTGAGGNITPLAASYSEGNFTCRDFLASYVRGEKQAWLQGEACRTDHGQWEVKSLAPLKRG